jgi:hypothetical protein
MREEEAGNQAVAYEAQANRFVEGLALEAEIMALDGARDDLLKADPANAEIYGLNKAEVEQNAKAQKEPTPEATPQPEATSARQPNESEYDFAARQLLDNPVAVDVLRSQVAAAEQARSQFAQQVSHAVRVAELSFLNQFPEFRGVTSQEHLASIANSIAQQNPQRWQAIHQTAAQATQLLQAQAVEQQHQAARAEHQLQSYKAEQDVAFNRAVGKVSNSDVEAVRSYLTDELGLTQQEIGMLHRNPVVIDARFQRALLDAGRYHALKNAPRVVPTRSAPRVQKPGTSAPRQSRADATEAQLMARLNASGSEADAWALLSSRIKGRG